MSIFLAFIWVSTVDSLEGLVPPGLALNLSSVDRKKS